MKTLKKFEFKSLADRATYDWEKLLDGGIYQMSAGDPDGDGKGDGDYHCKTATFATLCRTAARRRGKVVRTNVAEADEKAGLPFGGIVIQANEASEEQKAKWAAADAEKAAENGEAETE